MDSSVTHESLVKWEDYQSVVLRESRKDNYRNVSLDHYLVDKQISLPESDFLLIARQPNGIVSSCIVVDFTRRVVRILPGTHAKTQERIVELSKSEFDYLSELNASEIMKNFPSQNGKIGMDGHSIVVYSKSEGFERQISHWSPDYMGIEIFTSILEHFRDRPN